MFKVLRFSATILFVVWLGSMITISFFVAPSLFSNESGHTPDSSIAGDVISPLLHKMHVTSWIVIPIIAGLLFAMKRLVPLRSSRPVWVTLMLLAPSWILMLISGTVITGMIQDIRVELKAEFGGYHLAPKDDPRRAKFGGLHGASMMIAMLSLVLGAGAMFCATQAIEPATNKDEN